MPAVVLLWLVALLGTAAVTGPVRAAPNVEGESYADIPDRIDPERRYLFYMHGAWIEQGDRKRPHPRHGRYRYDEIVQALAQEGFTVISEARRGPARVRQYAEKVAGQVRRLLEAGVPPDHVTVIGHSKGGHMALFVSSLIDEPGVNVVVLAGCGRKGNRFGQSFASFVASRASRLSGRILSLYDTADRIAGSCRDAFDRAPSAKTEETVLETGRGHGLFYAPDSVWIDPLVKWARP